MATKQETERILGMLETKVDRAVTDISDIKSTVATEFDNLNRKIDGLDRKFAAKWVQTAVAFVIGIIISAVIYALIALVLVPSRPNNGSTSATSPSTSQTTTTTTPTGSTSTTRSSGSTGSSTPNSATANATSQSDGKKASDSDSAGGVQVTLPKQDVIQR